MVFVIGPECIDIKDKSCIEECPVDCIYEGDRKLYINPVECIDCGACESACPVQAISLEEDAETELQHEFVADNARFFNDTLPGRNAPIGTPGGAEAIGAIGADTSLVANYETAASSQP